MGIPKLFRQLSQNYNQILTTTKPSQSNIDWLGIDFNSLMHPVCAAKAATEEAVNWKLKRNWPILYKAILTELKKVLVSVSSNGSIQTVYIAIDGVVPMAKIIQQRQRRFRGSYERRNKKTNWDSCLISPGTFFMNGFERYLLSHTRELNVVKGFATTQFVISTTKEFGEGEHKIMKQLRSLSHSTSKSKPKTVAIYGLDADLIILGMTLTQSYSVYLFRENVHCSVSEFAKEDYILMSVNTLWDALVQEITQCMEQHNQTMRQKGMEPAKFTFDTSSLLRDFIVLTCYFGNDFVPAIPAFSLTLEDSIWTLLRAYATVLAEEGVYMIQSVTDQVFYWNTTFLLKLWNHCKGEESNRMKLKTIQWTRRRHPSRRNHPGDDLESPSTTFHKMPRKKQDWMRHALSSPSSYLSVYSSIEESNSVDYTLT